MLKGNKRCYSCDKYFPDEEMEMVYLRFTKTGKPIKSTGRWFCKTCSNTYLIGLV